MKDTDLRPRQFCSSPSQQDQPSPAAAKAVSDPVGIVEAYALAAPEQPRQQDALTHIRTIHMTTTSLRTAEPSDIETIAHLMQEYYSYDRLAFDPRMARIGLETLLRDSSLGRVWLIVEGTEIVGYLVVTFWFSLEFHGRVAFVDELYIQEQYRGQGSGTRALCSVEEFCSSEHFKALRLEVEHSNTRAYDLYRKNGFAEHHRHLMTKWIAIS